MSSSKPDLDIEGEDYYQGLIVKDDLPGLLETYGDYIVRTECKPGEPPIYVLCLNIGKESLDVKEFPIANDGGQYSLAGGQKYDKVVPLIKDLLDKKANLPECEHELVRAVKRPAWELSHEQVEINEEAQLGSGQFGKVCKGNVTLNGKKIDVAVKIAIKANSEQDHKVLLDTLKEARAMRNIDHPNCIKLYGIVIEREPVMLVIELVNMGSLLSYLKKERETPLTSMERAQLALQAAWGLEYLHTKHVIHRDIAARNCLLNKPEGSGDKIQVKIADFGLSRVGDNYKVQSKACLPVRYMAPEAIETGVFTSQTDVWMFGCLLFEIYSDGKTLYNGIKLPMVRERVSKGELQEIPDDFPNHAKELIGAAWQMDKGTRPSMGDLSSALEKYTKEPPPMVVDPKKIKKLADAKNNVDENKSGRGGKKKKEAQEKSVDGSARVKKDVGGGSARSGRKGKAAAPKKKPSANDGSNRSGRANNKKSSRNAKQKKGTGKTGKK